MRIRYKRWDGYYYTIEDKPLSAPPIGSIVDFVLVPENRCTKCMVVIDTPDECDGCIFRGPDTVNECRADPIELYCYARDRQDNSAIKYLPIEDVLEEI